MPHVLEIPSVVAFAGHMTDAPGREEPRFPPEKIGAVRRRIREMLERHKVGSAFGSAARGSDLIFLEEVLRRDGRATVFLPFPAQDFKKTSVGQGWDETFDRVLAHPHVEVKTLSEVLPPEAEQPQAYVRCNRAIRDAAIGCAERLDQKPLLLTVWNGKGGDGIGGTADVIREWRDQAIGEVLDPIDPMKLP